MLRCWRSQSKFFRSDSVSSVESILRLVVRGESDSGWVVLEVVIMIGRGRVGSCPGMCICALGSGDVATDGPFGVLVRDRRMAGVDFDAAF